MIPSASFLFVSVLFGSGRGELREDIRHPPVPFESILAAFFVRSTQRERTGDTGL